MTPNKDIEDDALGRWLVNEMSEEERIAFEASDAFKTYEAISQHTENLVLEPYNVEVEYSKLKKSIAHKKESKLVQMRFYRRLSIAASILVLLGVGSFFLLNKEVALTRHKTLQGQTKTITLPDNSVVEMNNLSALSYNVEQWKESRDVQLKGEAFFKVEKGSPFRVLMENGMIEVLGTSFNIKDRSYGTEVYCFTGKVRVTDSERNATILTKGMSAKIIDGYLDLNSKEEQLQMPLWKQGISRFENAPLADVIYELKGQFDIEIQVKSDISKRTYFGTHPNDNLEQALQLVFGSMQLEYIQESEGLVVVK